MSNLQKTKNYFETNPVHLKHAQKEYPLLYIESGKKINQYIHGIVLDIGSGGIINYDPTLVKHIILVDISTANKENATNKIFFLNSDVQKLGIKKNSVDCIIMQHLLHHLAGDTVRITEKNLVGAFHETHRVLKKGGILLIIEGFVPYPFELLQKILFPFDKRLYCFLFNFPMVLQYSYTTILKQLKQEQFTLVSIASIEDGDVLPIFGMNLPRKYIPLKHKIIIAKT